MGNAPSFLPKGKHSQQPLQRDVRRERTFALVSKDWTLKDHQSRSLGSVGNFLEAFVRLEHALLLRGKRRLPHLKALSDAL